MVDTEKCFKQKLYDVERNIRRYLWFNLGWHRQDKIDFLKRNIIFLIPESNQGDSRE